MRHNAMLQLSTAPQLPKGHADVDDERPAKETLVMAPPAHDRRQTDASKLNFPLPMTITAVVFALSIGGAVWSIASDVRNIGTRFDGQAETLRIQRDLDRERLERSAEKAQANIDALRATVDTIQKEQRLTQIELQNFRESVLNMQGRR